MGMTPQNRVDDELFNIDRQIAALSGPSSTDSKNGMSNHQKFMLLQALRRKRQRIAGVGKSTSSYRMTPNGPWMKHDRYN